ncbi:hypothetical protein B9Z55_009497 [Caenorhabditis nigoni]|uniref:F-box domain-containing protein n=1 Tax=Caenorhabditis nigoni TaxID=1611254 RepID=A0A2G5US87_9PELO|nr:hypothetical protein B9Z55_009497 [Caenorhabditis nigoni]
MSRVIGRLPASLDEQADSDEENDADRVFADESVPVFPCYNQYPKKSIRLSVSKNSARLKSINLNDVPKKGVITLPIRRKGFRSLEDPFRKYKVPEEVIDVIFSNLRKRDLLAVMAVCKSFYAIGTKSKNWLTTDVMERPVSELALAGLMKRKIRVLRLAGAKADPISRVNIRLYAKTMHSQCRLEFLDLSRANLTERQLLIILKPCVKLQCLSIEGNILSNEVARCIAANRDLLELDISMTRGISVEGARMIVQNCTKLEQFNASWCELDRVALDVIVHNITGNIRKLNLSGSVRGYGLNGEHIDILSQKADEVMDLDLSDSGELTDASIATVIAYFPHLTQLSINRCYGIDPNMLIHLNNKASLRFLNVHGNITETNMDVFLRVCDRLRINSQLFNHTAKPVSNNEYTIWGNSMLEK